MRILILLFIHQLSFAQIIGTVKDSKTKEPISFVNIGVENQNIGVSANEKGEFSLPNLNTNDVVIFSAVGYKMLKINAEKIPETIFLEQQIIDLGEILVKPRRNKNSKSIVKFNSKKVDAFFANRGLPQITAKYIPYTESISTTRFIKSIKIVTRSEIKNSIFNIRLYTPNDKGEPSEFYYNQNIVGTCAKGKKITEINVENLNIRFPESGLFVGAEWLIVEQNKFVSEYYEVGKKEKIKSTEYSPWFGGNIEKENFGWTYLKNSKWQKQSPWSSNHKNFKGKYHSLAVQILLTD
ncbi:carboxypeptidase-like regulatory domain-containing protein [Lacihabitans soyangensis]|uniref:Carboxypeptidase-like regulatory domain-containing protein n=1 Tax=Lacihabitans soyangensis TaxID=869394 RepID=A0AAE3H4P8_9BACT|nr:carboxypeptidase-like regulatory domain-containing protein [Lacihabitans soyangensis]MCP9764912.1 carboxypeptidase-like regulatory domain-containing protein [Lacihabitans soyangensis]